jgi:hypothetical protein
MISILPQIKNPPGFLVSSKRQRLVRIIILKFFQRHQVLVLEVVVE